MRTSARWFIPVLAGVLALLCGLVALPAATAAVPAATAAVPTPGVPSPLSVVCPDVGQVLVASPPILGAQPALPDRGLLRVHVGYTAVDQRSARTITAGAATDAGAVLCDTLPLRGRADTVARGPLPNGVRPSDLLTGRYSITVEVLALPAPTRNGSPSAAASAVQPFPSEAQLAAYLNGRPGSASVAMFDPATDITYAHAPSTTYVTASIVKVAILGTLLRDAAAQGRYLTSNENALATRMIEVSDNDAATALWNEIGGGAGLAGFTSLVGMSSTTPGPDGYWGLTQTTAPDQVLLMRTVSYPNNVLSDSARSYMLSLMSHVESDQRWGVSAGAPAGATVAIKNGWLPRTGGWAINSIGHIYGLGRDFVLAELSFGSPTMSTGVATVEGAARIVCAFPSPWSRLPGTARDFGAGETGATWIVATNPVGGGFGLRSWTGSGWAAEPGGAVAVDVDAAGTPWLVNDAGAIYRRSGSAWQRLPGAAHAIGAGPAGTAWIVGRTPTTGGYGIYRWTGSGWEAVPGGAASIDVDASGTPWLVNSDGAIFREKP